MAYKQLAVQQAIHCGDADPGHHALEGDLVSRFRLKRALIVDVDLSYHLVGLLPPDDSPRWILLEDIAAMSQWAIMPPRGDFDCSWPLWSLEMVAGTTGL